MQDSIYQNVDSTLNQLCNAPAGCFNASRALSGDYLCDQARMNFSTANPNTVCNGSCLALMDAVVAECGNVSV